MVTLQYYDELKEAVKVPSSITDFFASSVDDSNEEKLLYSVMLEVGLPVEKWLFYVITHEENAFKRFFDCKPNENDRRLCPKELFYCLRPLSDENRRFIFGKLSDISDGVINKLSKYVEEDNLVEFSNVINETNVNTSSIASICMNVKALIDNYNAMEQLYLNVGQIIQIDDEAEMFRQMEKVFNVFLSNFESINGDEQATDQVVNYVNNLFEELSRNDNFSEVAGDLTIKKYHYCLWLYHHIWPDDNQSNGFATRVALDYLEELVFNPKYEKYWKGYENDTCLGELEKEMKNWLGVAIEENQKEQKEEVKDVPKKPLQIAQETDEETLRLQNYLCKEPKLDKKSKLDYCKGFKRSIAKAGYAGDKALAKFIQGIADRKYIDDDTITKKSFAYALTGRGGFRKMKIIKVKWHHKDSDTREVPESVRVLLYISSNLFDSDKTKGSTYSQLFDVLNAGSNPCIKDGKDQSSSYYDKVSDDFKEFFKECFGQFAKDFDKNNHKE